jgi:phage recombination protein Bet
MTKSQEMTTTAPQAGLLETFGMRYNVPAKLVRETLQRTAFPDAKNDSEFIAMLVVANEYRLNPFTKQIYAFSKNGKVTPVVSIDGWIKVINEQETLESIEFSYADKKVVIGSSKPCFEWVECSIERSDREKPIVVREYFDECYMNTLNWNNMPKRMLRHRALIQAGHYAFGLSFSDPDSEQRIKMGIDDVDGQFEAEEEKPKTSAEKAKKAMRKATTPPKEQEPAPEPPAPSDEVVEGEEALPAGVEEIIIDESYGEVVEEAEWEDDIEVNETTGEIVVQPVTARQAGTISAARTKNKWPPELFERLLGEFGVSEVTQLPAARYDEFIQILRAGGETQEALL